MTPKRVLEVVNNTRVPDRKKKFWPTHSVVFVSAAGEILDVIQYFESPTREQATEDHSNYPESAYFYATVGMYNNESEIEEKVRGCREALGSEQVPGHIGASLELDGQWIPSAASELEARRRKE